MEKDTIKIAFQRVKGDMLFLNNELTSLRYELEEIKNLLKTLNPEANPQKLRGIQGFQDSTDKPTDQQTIRQIIPTYTDTPTQNPTVPLEVKGLKTQKTDISTGNEGVPTDKQTNKQTDQQITLKGENIELNLKKAQEILGSLDSLKKEIRLKFKRLTPQEMTVFSSIYQLEEEDKESANYKKIAEILNLSESSIRDYVLKIIDKGIPIKKQKIDNKKVILSISPDLKNIAPLSTIIQLREL